MSAAGVPAYAAGLSRNAPSLGADFEERLTLRDGSPVLLRSIRPDDKHELVAAFERLSPLSRYRRFLGPKGRLTESELRYLTEIDWIDHAAIVGEGAAGEGLGVARFIRSPGADWAEAAITVADAHQGKGLGRLLLERLVLAASERGIRRFRFDILGSNAPMLAMVQELAPSASSAQDGTVVHVEVPLPAPGERDADVFRLLALGKT